MEHVRPHIRHAALLAKHLGRSPVCGGPSRPLHGLCNKQGCDCHSEADVPSRMKLGRTSDKCFGKQQRFDVNSSNGQALPDMLRVENGGSVQTLRAGTKISA